MRHRVNQNGMEVTVIIGTYAALLSIRITDEANINKPDFLGFSIKRNDLTENESYFLSGFKHFEATGNPTTPGQLFSTDQQPIQSFFWEDYTVKPGHNYSYEVIPVYGKPKNLTVGKSVVVPITSESEFGAEHSVHFNMGVAGSLAYARKFNNKRPDQMTDAEKATVRKWLSRGLEEALLGFIQKAIDNKCKLRTAFYEFTYPPVLEQLKQALASGIDVQIIYDSRAEEEENDDAIKAVGLPKTATVNGKAITVLHPRKNDPQVPAHNKFMILLDQQDNPQEVWTGSTNITDKGILGQSNVGHHIANEDVAKQYYAYWNDLVKDPDHAPFQKSTNDIQADIATRGAFTNDVTVFFSPRSHKVILDAYASFIDSAKEMVCGIFPFSFSKAMKDSLSKPGDVIRYLMVDKISNADGIVLKDKDTLIVNGAYFTKPIFDWLDEINSGILLNKNHNPTIGTNYVHNKVLLIDPLGTKPAVVMGSANFSDVSVTANDENTMVITGGKELRRICDIYFTEFYRLFHHFFIRKATMAINGTGNGNATSKAHSNGNGHAAAAVLNNPILLKTDNSWVGVFRADAIKVKMQTQLTGMPETLPQEQANAAATK